MGYMSIKKELLNELNEDQLRKLADDKGINLTLNTVRKTYYENWSEKDKLVDIMSDVRSITVSDIEQFILKEKNQT